MTAARKPPCTCDGAICGTNAHGINLRRNYCCASCQRWVPWCYGSADDMPEHCDGCWAAAHTELVPAGLATPETYR